MGPLYGLVLAGGESRRMGVDKAMLEYHGVAQARYCQGLLARHCDQAFVSLRKEQNFNRELIDLPLLHDIYFEIGPLGGLLSAMEAYPEAAWLLLASDMPDVDDRLIEVLIAGRNRKRLATAFMRPEGFADPMCAVYEPGCRTFFDPYLARKRTGLRYLLEAMDIEALAPPDPQALESVNSLEAYRRYHQR